ncbi:MAG TPA: molybdopterin cofactor-binding domain-containing protein [Frankiaceae bacterium]|nr:molybdopterin cofactor-binding domain-containing protein [Frankiaceae bacterium]
MRLNVNGTDVDVDDRHAATPLLWVLRDVLGMPGTKFGCGAGFCAACTVLIDGKNEKSCQAATGRAVGRAVTTVEGVAGRTADAVREAWHRDNVVQCGYCQPGQTLAAIALLEAEPSPDDPTISRWMNGNLCRCGTYPRTRRAIHDAADILASGAEPVPPTATPEPDPVLLTDDEASDPIHPYIRIRPDGTIVVFSSQIEMGQGIHTGLATLVSEELDADFDAVRVVNAANGRRGERDVYGNPEFGGQFQITGNSNSTKGFWSSYRLVAAKARARLVAAAAAQWNVPANEINVDTGILRHREGLQATFAELAAAAESIPVPDSVQPKTRAEYKLIGREGRLRIDAPNKILGKTPYTIDVSLPHLLTAVVLHPPRFGAKIADFDDRAALDEAGVVAVVAIEEGIAVVGETFADAHKGLQALDVTWDDTDAERRSSEQLREEHRKRVETGENAVVVRDEGDTEARLAQAAYSIDAIYELPYLAHATMEPNNAICSMGDDGVIEVWAPTESPAYTAMAAAAAGGVDADHVHVHVTFAGGSFGLHSSSAKDPTTEAVQVARALHWKHPVKVQSLREEEFKVGRYRPMSAHRVRAGADADGRLSAVHHRIAAQPTSVNLPFVRDVMFTNDVDFFTTTGAVDNPYAYPAFRLESSNVDTGVSLMVWRSVGNSHTEFARECALDELAVAAARDPIELRRELLKADPRTLAALELAATVSGWDTPLPEGRARGIACSGFLSPHAQITEVTLDERGRVRVERIVFALDCGIAINPDLIRAQIEGGILWGLSAAAWGEIVLGEGGDILTQNFDRYPVMRMQSVPEIEVHLIDSNEPPSGVGEVAVPTTAPALANAIAALTGNRIRRLPISKSQRIY